MDITKKFVTIVEGEEEFTFDNSYFKIKESNRYLVVQLTGLHKPFNIHNNKTVKFKADKSFEVKLIQSR